jgi:hypothetical protein
VVGARLVGGVHGEGSTSPGGSAARSVDTSLAGFGRVGGHPTGRFCRRRWRGSRIAIPAALMYALAVSRRTPVACSMRRSGHPSRPRARTCCFFPSPKKWPSRRGITHSTAASTSWGGATSLAGFQVSMTGRSWVSTEGNGLGFLDNGSWLFDLDGNGQWDGCVTDACLGFGLPADLPVVGDWTVTGFSEIGVFEPASTSPASATTITSRPIWT